MRVFPIHTGLQTYFECCGNTICGGCNYQHQIKSIEQALHPTCAFCRTALPKSDEERLTRTRKRVKLKDRNAIRSMARDYGYGELKDRTKCIDLLRQAADLGCSEAQYQLGQFHYTGTMGPAQWGFEQNKEEALKYWGKAAEGGHILAQYNLGCDEDKNGNDVAAMRRYRLSASGGLKKSMNSLICCFKDGDLHHGDLAESLQAYYRSRSEMKSEGRDQHIAYMKRKGEYEEEYDM